MISLPVRVLAIAASFAYMLFIINALRASHMNVRQSLWWLTSAGVFVIISVFPSSLVYWGTVLGFVAPSNALFLVWCLALTILVCYQAMTTSKQSEEIRKLAQAMAIERLKNEQRVERSGANAAPPAAPQSPIDT